MQVEFIPAALKQYGKLSPSIKKKADKKLLLLLDDPYHPLLYSKKMGVNNKFEGRIDYHYRFTYIVTKAVIYVLSIGMHDSGLGKK